MSGFRFSSTPAVVAGAVSLLLLAYQTGAQAVSQQQDLRKLAVNDYTHLGCFSDDPNDRIFVIGLVDGGMTTEMCFNHCNDEGASLMATQYGKECWCGSEPAVDYDRHGPGTCSLACGGNAGEECGGYNALDVYIVGSFHPDIVDILDVDGDDPGGVSWADSYSYDGICYMTTTWDHDVSFIEVDTPQGTMTIRALFDKLALGPGPDGRPLYNDIQCGNGPANSASDEVACPGLVEYGQAGCGQTGPLWNLSELE